ncbi:MAG: AMP-binding protein [Bacillota bacterium]
MNNLLPDYEIGKQTLINRLDMVASNYPQKEAIVIYENNGSIRKSMSYGELKEYVIRTAQILKSTGVESGDHIVLLLPNSIEFVVFTLASALLRAIVVPANTFYKEKELEYVIRQSESKFLVYKSQFAEIDLFKLVKNLCPEITERDNVNNFNKFPMLKSVICVDERCPIGALNYKKLLESETRKLELLDFPTLDPDDVILMLYTSGTTGFPKGAMLTNTNVLTSQWYYAEIMKACLDSRFLCTFPFFHIGGLGLGVIACILKGSCLIGMERFNPDLTLKIIEKERCSHMLCVNTVFITLLNHPKLKEYDYSSLRMVYNGGAPCPIKTNMEIMKSFKTDLVIGFGQTETSPIITMTKPEDPLELRIGSVGRVAIPGCEVKVIDPATGEQVKPGEVGEIVVRGPIVMKGYWKMPEETAKTIDKDGWLHTGDLVTFDENYYYKTAGRLKDMIIVGGENVYATEVEDIIRTHPKVKDVAYIGIPDSKYGEVGFAFIQLKENEVAKKEEIMQFCKQNMASFKVPRFVEFIEEYPLTSSGKIKKFLLRDMAKRKLGLVEEELC